MHSLALAKDLTARLQMFRQVVAVIQNGEPTPFKSGAYGTYCSPRHNPSKYKAAADLLLLAHTRAFTRVPQYVLPSPDLEENVVPMLDRETLFQS